MFKAINSINDTIATNTMNHSDDNNDRSPNCQKQTEGP